MAKSGGGSRGGSKGGGSGSSNSKGGTGSLNSLPKFQKAALKELDALSEKYNSPQVLIADIRDALKGKVNRETFDKNLKELQAKGIIQTVSGGPISRMNPDIDRNIRDGIRTELGGDRVFVRREA